MPLNARYSQNKGCVVTLWPCHLPMKEGSLFCFLVMRSTEHASDPILGVFGTLVTKRGARAWFHDIWTCGAKVLEY
jgi:hypothetical protein